MKKNKDIEIENEKEYKKFLEKEGIKNVSSYINGLLNLSNYLNIDISKDRFQGNTFENEVYANLDRIRKNAKKRNELKEVKRIENFITYSNRYKDFVRSQVEEVINTAPSKSLVKTWLSFIETTDNLRTILNYGTSNITGDFAEKLCIDYFNGIKAKPSEKSFDFMISKNKVQVKSRRLNKKNNPCTQLNVIRSLDFNNLITVIFANDGSLYKVIKHSVAYIEKEAIYNAHQNGRIITTTQKFYNDGEELTKEFSNKFKIPTFNNK